MNKQQIIKYSLVASAVILTILVIYYSYKYVKKSSQKITEKFSYGMAFGANEDEYKKQLEENNDYYISPADTAETMSPEVLKVQSQEQELINRGKMLAPEELLPVGTDDYALIGKNFLSSSFDHGMDTRGATMKNANLQLRSDPVIPRNDKLTPFNQSTSEQDTVRKVVNF